MTNQAARFPTAVTWVLLAACGALIAASAAGAFLPQADSINIFAPFWIAGTVAVLLAILLVRRRRLRQPETRAALALLVATLVLGGVLLSPIVGGKKLDTATPSLRLITFNMYKANPDPPRIVRWILAEQADFVVLLEVSPVNRPVLLGLQRRFPYRYNCSARKHCSTYILSRVPAERVWPLALGDADNRRALSALTARFRLRGEPLAITAVHLNHPWPRGNQSSQIELLTNVVAGSSGPNGLIAGDFNSAPWTFALRRLAAAADAHLISGAIGTWPTDATLGLARLPLDQIYAGPCFAVYSVSRGPALGSDHFPLVTDLVPGTCHD